MFSGTLAAMLARPTYGQGLFEVGQKAGMTPTIPGQNEALLAEQQKQKALQGGLLGMAQTVANGATPEQVAAMGQGLAGQGASAEQVMAAQEIGKQRNKEALKAKGKQSIASIVASQDVSNPQVIKAIRTVALRTGVDDSELNGVISQVSKSPWMISGNNAFNKDTGEWSSPPSKEQAESVLGIMDRAELMEKFTNTTEFLADPENVELIPRKKEKEAKEPDAGPSPTDRIAQYDLIDSAVTKAENLLNSSAMASGVDAQLSKWVASSPAGQLDSTYKSIQSQEFLNWITDLKSKAGGIGAISNAEGQRFESAVKALDPAMDKDQQLENLAYIKEFRRRAMIMETAGDGDTDFYKNNPAKPGYKVYRSISNKLFEISPEGKIRELSQ